MSPRRLKRHALAVESLYHYVLMQLYNVTPSRATMPPARMTPELFEIVAERFKAFGEPTRLHILYELRADERAVGDLVKATGIGQANLSRHLGQLHAAGLVARRKEGLYVYYSLADKDVLKLCDVMCGRLSKESNVMRKALSAG
jgi:DNA-binding transcriptional ArsR family regulator